MSDHAPANTITEPLQRLICADVFEHTVRNLEKVAQPNAPPAEQLACLEKGLRASKDLPNSLQRLAWLSTFGSATTVRSAKESLIYFAWEIGVNRTAGGMADPSGVAAILAVISTAIPLKIAGYIQRVADAKAFETLVHEAGDSVHVADAAHLASMASFESVKKLYGGARAANQPGLAVICHLTLWLLSMGSPQAPRVSLPRHSAVIELLSAPWLRGLRRNAARRLGLAQGTELRKMLKAYPRPVLTSIPKSLVCPKITCQDRKKQATELLAPLIVEWLSCLLIALEPGGDSLHRADTLRHADPLLPERLTAAVGEENRPAIEWLNILLPLGEEHAGKAANNSVHCALH